MSEEKRGGPASSREWRGTHQTWKRAYSKYEFPVTTYKVGPKGERIPVEAVNS